MKYNVTVKEITHYNGKDKVAYFDEIIRPESTDFDFEKHYKIKSKLYNCLLYPIEIKLLSKLD